MPFIISKPEPQKTIQAIVNSSQDFEIIAGVLIRYKGAAIDVVIPDGVVEIASGAFAEMKTITSIMIPDSVKRIGNKNTFTTYGAFSYCTDLRKINIPDSAVFVGRSIPFYRCDSLREIEISIDKLLSLSKKELFFLYVDSRQGGPYSEVLLQRIKQECGNRGICWSCRKPLVLTDKGECSSCWAKGHLPASDPKDYGISNLQDFEINDLKNFAIKNLQNYAISSPQDFEIVAGVLKKYKGTARDVVIPDGVVEIANGAFNDMPFYNIN